MTFVQRIWCLLLIVAIAAAAIPAAAQNARFRTFYYSSTKQYTLVCVAQEECTVTLQPGEEITQAFIGDSVSWQPHKAYLGSTVRTPQIVVRPDRAGLATNVVVDTSMQHVYHFWLESVSPASALTYYSFATPAPRNSGIHVTYAPAAIVTPAPMLADVDLSTTCTDDRYSVDPTPVQWRPVAVCNDNSHTFIQLAQLARARADVPIVHAIRDGAQTLVNYTYDARTSRYIVDGVYPELALIGGTPAHPFVLRILHSLSYARATPAPTPAPIVTPVAVMGPHGPILYTPPPNPAPVGIAQGNPQRFDGAASTARSGAPLPIFNGAGVVVAYTTADLATRQGFLPVLDGSGSIVGYTITVQGAPAPGQAAPMLIAQPGAGRAGCPQPNPAVHDSGWDSHTKWSRDFRYLAQGADAFVTASALHHGANSTGIFSFIRSPIGFLVAQAAENYLVDRITAKACPRVQNAVNTALGLSAVMNALKGGSTP